MNIKNIPFLIAEISANHCGNFNYAKFFNKIVRKFNCVDY